MGDGRDRPATGDPATRRSWRIAGWGTVVLGGGLAAVAAAAGADGRQGFAFFLLGAVAATVTAALHAVVSGVLDALRGRDVPRQRAVAAVVLVALSVLLPAMLVGLGG